MCILKVEFQSAYNQGYEQTIYEVVLFSCITASSCKLAIHMLRSSMWQSDKSHPKLFFLKRIYQFFITRARNRKRLLTRGSYYELSPFSKYLHPVCCVTLVTASTKTQPPPKPDDVPMVKKLCTGKLIFWVPLEVLEYKFCDIRYFVCCPQINWPKYLFSYKALIIEKHWWKTEKIREEEEEIRPTGQLTTFINY